jgi:hypothetical protein
MKTVKYEHFYYNDDGEAEGESKYWNDVFSKFTGKKGQTEVDFIKKPYLKSKYGIKKGYMLGGDGIYYKD